MWPLYLDRTVTVRRRVRGSMASVCEIVESPENFGRLQPLVTKFDQDPSNPQRYKITERVKAPGGLWEYDNTFYSVFVPKEDEGGRGMDVQVELSQKLVIPNFRTKIRAKETQESGVVEVSEVLEIRVSCVLAPYVVSTMTKAHEDLMDRLKAKVEDGGN